MRDKQDIAFIGTMASGKTTVAKLLAERLSYKLFEEFFTGNPYLERYYQDPKRWALASEMWFLMEKAQQHYNIAYYPEGTVQDSPLVSVVYFSMAMLDSGCLELEDYSLIIRAFNYIYGVTPKPTDYIYLKVPVDVTMRRISDRNRGFEQTDTVGREYIERSVDNIESILDSNYIDRRVTIVNGNQSPNDVVDEIIGKVV